MIVLRSEIQKYYAHTVRTGSIIFGRVHMVAKSAYRLRHVRPSAGISRTPTWWISVKFDIRDFYDNLSKNSKFVYNRTETSGTFLEDLRTFYCCRRHEFATNAFLFNNIFILLTVACSSTDRRHCFHCNNGYAKAPRQYVICKQPVLLNVKPLVTKRYCWSSSHKIATVLEVNSDPTVTQAEQNGVTQMLGGDNDNNCKISIVDERSSLEIMTGRGTELVEFVLELSYEVTSRSRKQGT